MQIERVRLKNIKNYSDTEITFHAGVNFIKGKNGAGKSTLIESIGYALFNCYDGRGANEDFLSFGEAEGEMEIDFTGAEGEQYRVFRRLALKPNRRVWHIFNRENMAQAELYKEDEKKMFLADAMGLAKERDIAWMFRDIIGVRQGAFKEPFEKTLEERKNYFNKIFGVEDYTRAFVQLGEVANELKSRGDIVANSIAFLTEAALGLEEKQAEARQIAQDMEGSGATLKSLQAQIKRNAQALNLERLQKEEKVKTEKEILSAEELQKRLAMQMQEKAEQIKLSQKALERLGECEAGYSDYLALKQKLDALEVKQKEKQALSEETSKMQALLGRLEGEIAGEEKTLAERAQGIQAEEDGVRAAIVAAEEKTNALEKEAAKAAEAEKRLEGLANTAAKSDAQIEKVRGFIKGELTQKATQYANLKGACAEVSGRIQELETLRGRETELEEKKRGKEELARQESALTERLEAIDRYAGSLKIGICPFFERECEAAKQQGQEGMEKEKTAAIQSLAKVREGIKELEAGIAALKAYEALGANITDLNRQLKEKEDQMGLAGTELAKTADRPASWDIAAQTETLLGEYRAFTGEIQEKNPVEAAFGAYREAKDPEEKAAKYENAFTAFEEFIQAFKGKIQNLRMAQKSVLGQRNATVAAAVAEKNALVKREAELAAETKKLAAGKALLTEKHTRKAQSAAELSRMQTGLQAYAGLENEIALYKKEALLKEADYTAYIQNKPEADKLPALKQAAVEIAAKQEAAVTELDGYRQKLAKNNYNAAHEETLMAEAAKLSQTMGGEQARLVNLAEAAKRVEAEIAQKLTSKQKLDTALARQRKLNTAAEILKNTRSAMKIAGPRIAGIYRKRVQARADSIYRGVAKEGVNLVWTDQYELELHDSFKGQERVRTFRQLSGGEKMTAALSIRLGLLETFSGAGIGFFDEPTDNMDAARRENLAELLSSLCAGFSQVFIVSHDDTFDKITDNVVYLQDGQAGGL